MSIPSPAELRRTKQPIPTDKLIRWAEEAGFETRRSAHGSSHINCRHSEYKDICFGIVVNSKQLGSQRCLSDALLMIEKRIAQKKEIVQAFETASAPKLTDVSSKLPPHIKAQYDYTQGVIVLRDQQLPQLGATLRAGEERLLENKIRHIEDLKKQAYTAINLSGIRIGRPDRDMQEQSFSHPVYDIPAIHAKPYQAGQNTDMFFPQMAEFIEAIGLRDLEHREKLEKLLSASFIKATTVVYSSRRGERTNVITVDSPTHKPLRVEFDSFSNCRVKFYNDVLDGRVSEKTLSQLETRLEGLARAHAALPRDRAPVAAVS